MAAKTLPPLDTLLTGSRHQLDNVWQEFIPNVRCKIVTIHNQDPLLDIRVAFSVMGFVGALEFPADNGVVGTQYEIMYAGQTRAFRLQDVKRAGSPTHVFIAGSAAPDTPWCSIGQEVEGV